MTRFWYEIEAASESIAQYVRHLIRGHGLAYSWSIKTSSDDLSKAIRVAVGTWVDNTIDPQNGTHDQSGRVLLAETILTTNQTAVRRVGLRVQENEGNQSGHWGYLVRSGTIDGHPEEAIPFPLEYIGELVLGEGWMPNCLVIGAAQNPGVVSATRVADNVKQTIFCIDLMEFLAREILGPVSSCGGDARFEDWAEAYGEASSQALSSVCYVDQILQLIGAVLIEACAEAMPVVIDYYPPGKSAPLIVTGDTDDASASQLQSYLLTLENYGVRASLLIRQFIPYAAEQLEEAFGRGHCFGIHPYSEGGLASEFAENFTALVSSHMACFGEPVYGVRNHRFQWIERTNTIRLERQCGVIFDLNCVAASGHSWLGTGSGVGFPIAFPPLEEDFSLYPLQLPTVLEDDVFLFTYDYCYRPFDDGDDLPKEAAIRFLQDWLITRRWPATVNLHPEHIAAETRGLLDAVLEWASSANLWMPSLREFAEWLEARSSTLVEVTLEGNEAIVSISTLTPVLLRLSLASAREDDHNYFVITESCKLRLSTTDRT
jgi:hypothetical protein